MRLSVTVSTGFLLFCVFPCLSSLLPSPSPAPFRACVVCVYVCVCVCVCVCLWAWQRCLQQQRGASADHQLIYLCHSTLLSSPLRHQIVSSPMVVISVPLAIVFSSTSVFSSVEISPMSLLSVFFSLSGLRLVFVFCLPPVQNLLCLHRSDSCSTGSPEFPPPAGLPPCRPALLICYSLKISVLK